ncbi:MAG: hypothetical protein AAFY28_17070 [Actinomycetota bacterium]
MAVCLGAGGFGLVQATIDAGERPVLININPCRITDTRGPDNIGPRSTAIGAGETYTISAHGTNGNCQLPSTATALSLNVTAVGATEQTNVRVFPAGGALPTASNLNPSPGSPPVPNAVTVGLSSDGEFNVFNFNGQVDLVIDVSGFYEDHNHDDRYYTKDETYTRAEVDAAIDETYTQAEVDAAIDDAIEAALASQNNGDDTGVEVVPINYRGNEADEFTLVEMNGITVQVECLSGSFEAIEVVTAVAGGEISSVSFDPSDPSDDTLTLGNYDGNFQVGDVFAASGDLSFNGRQTTITYIAPDGANVTVLLVSGGIVGGADCVVSGFAIGAPPASS